MYIKIGNKDMNTKRLNTLRNLLLKEIKRNTKIRLLKK
jgi:hypothetical protein